MIQEKVSVYVLFYIQKIVIISYIMSKRKVHYNKNKILFCTILLVLRIEMFYVLTN